MVAAVVSWSWWTFHAQEMAVIAAIGEHELRAHRGETTELQAGARASSPLPGDRVAPNSPPAGLTDAKKREFEALAAELRTQLTNTAVLNAPECRTVACATSENRRLGWWCCLAVRTEDVLCAGPA